MAMPTSGPISFNDLRTETGISGAISISDGKVLDLIGRVNNVDMATARGKTSSFSITITASDSRRFITTMAYDAGWQGTGDLYAAIGFGTVSSTIVTGQNSWGEIHLVIFGYLAGKGGNGGRGLGGVTDSGAFNTIVNIDYRNGDSGGDGLVVSAPPYNRVQRLVRLTNYGTIAAGGGGGGGGDAIAAGTGAGDVDMVGGGGGGGGAGNAPGSPGGGGIASVINGGGSSVNGDGGYMATLQDPADGGAAGVMPRFTNFVGGRGGRGGVPGAGGAAGGANSVNWGYQGSGGAAGYAVIGYSNLTVALAGTIIGTLG